MPQNNGVVMSPIQSEKKRSLNEPVYHFTWFDVIVVLVSMGTYLADIITDILVTLVYWKLDEKIWAGLTLTFLIVPSIIMQIFSTRWYVADGHKATCSMFFIHLFMMGPIKRYIAVLKHGIRAKKTKRIEDYQAMYSELSDVSMLRLFESFLESAPQLVLQLYIMIKVTEDDHILTGIAAFFSLISLAWAIAAYTKALRTAAYSRDSRKKRVSWSGLALQTLWRVGMVAGRIVALVLFATAYPMWLLAGVGIHWLVMTLWLVAQDTDFCGTWWEERLFNAVVGVIHIFCFFNMKEGKSRWRMIVFYLITFIENSAMILLWFPHRTIGTWYNSPAMIVVWGGFIIGFSSMLLYYRYFHPSSLKKCHCCMLYYHLVYRCCPCHDVTAFNGTPYKRNLNADDSSSNFVQENSETSDHRENHALRRGIGEEGAHKNLNSDEFGTPEFMPEVFREDFGLGSGRMMMGDLPKKNLHHHRGKDTKKLLMPKPKLTSTPGDDLDEKFVKILQTSSSNHVDFHENDEQMTLTGLSRSSERDDTTASVGDDKIDSVDPLVSTTPIALKNLPGAETGPCTNKGNSTLVREWVKKTQDIYGGCTEEGASARALDTCPDFGTLRFAKKEEREFMEMHFGDVRALPSGKRDILRLKSFNKKDRQQPTKRGKKRKQSSYNVSDLRNTFREAFGFHTIVANAEDSESNGPCEIVRKQPSRRHSFTWEETETDGYPRVGVRNKRGRATPIKTEVKIAARSSKNKVKKSKTVNRILARIDQPPDLTKMREEQNLPKLQDPKINVRSTVKEVIREDQEEMGVKIDIDNLHGTAAIVPLKSDVTHVPIGTKSSNGNVPHGAAGMFRKKDSVGSDCVVWHEMYQPSSNKEWTTMAELDGQGCIKLEDGETNIEADCVVATQKTVKVQEEKTQKIEWKKPNKFHMPHVLPPSVEQGEQSSGKDPGTPNVDNPHGAFGCDALGDVMVKTEDHSLESHLLSSKDPDDPAQNCKHEGQSSILAPLVDKSVYDNLTASLILQADDTVRGHSNEENGLLFDAEKDCMGILAPQEDVFGAVIQIRGDRITVKHKNEVNCNTEFIFNPVPCMDYHSKPKLISNHVPVFQASVVRANLEKAKFISDPAKKQDLVTCVEPTVKIGKNSKQASSTAVRRDRIEYLYKIGRHGLKKSAENSPARKRLSFKKLTQLQNENPSPTQESNINSANKEQQFSEITPPSGENIENPTENSQKHKMQKSIEALGTSMEGMVNAGENYTIRIHDKSPRRTTENLRTMRQKNMNRKRRTLGAIENH